MKLALALALAPVASAFFGGAKPSPPRAPWTRRPTSASTPARSSPRALLRGQGVLARRRAVEIKHGRIAMTAFIGMMVQELGITFPGSITLDGSVKFADIGTGFAAIENIPKFGLFQIVAFASSPTAAMPAPNGRAAMLGVTGAMIHSQLDSCDHHFFYPITHN
ncbi:chlorophyll A-B binding protein [Aureococcus anophagefferens]|nr:chlorophyll A-B binding protein [Aureococcus anophagefferens]